MKKLELSVSELKNIVANNEIVGNGSYGIIYKIDENTLFKFNYKDFINNFEVKDGRINIRKLFLTEKEIKDLKKIDSKYILQNKKKLIDLKDKIRLTKLTQGIVYIKRCCIGYLLHYHKNMVNLFEYLKNNKVGFNDKRAIFNNIKNATKELCDNNIFMGDLTTKNILIDPQTNKIQIIDFEDVWTSVREDQPLRLIEEMDYKLKEIEKFLEDIENAKNKEDRENA